MSWQISKEWHFSASHQLKGLPDDHQCARLHGHNYILTVRLRSNTLQEPGFVMDYGEMTWAKEWVDQMDHRHLNDLFRFNPTSENIVQHFWMGARAKLDELNLTHIKADIGLSETPKTWAWYIEADGL